MGLREEKKDRTRRDLVHAALRLFNEHGFEATPVRAIAEACQVSPATVYVYFPAKDDLVFPDRTVHAQVLADVLAARGPDRNPRAALVAAVRALLDAPAWSIDPDDPLAVIRGRVIAASPTLRARALVELAALAQQWAALLRAAHPDQLDDVAAAAHTGAVLGAVVAAVVTERRSDDLESPLLQSLVERALQVIDPSGDADREPAGGSR